MIPKKNLPMLLNLAYNGFNRGLPPNGDLMPMDGVTHCNQFINYVCSGLGYEDFTGMLANEMVKFMSDPKNGWISVSDDVAQAHANSGVIVIAGWSNPEGHGHVALVLPGILEKSHSFGRAVPKIVNVGQDVFFGKRLSSGFSQQHMPSIHVLAGMI
jgi:hypothetical protein